MISKPQAATLPSERTILGRFAHLVSAQGVDGVASIVFFLYLAWLDKSIFGSVMYAMAAGETNSMAIRNS